MPVDRNWTVPENRQPLISFDEGGNLVVHPHVVADDDDDALAVAVWEAIAILRRVGGTLQVASQRAEIAPNAVVTESYIFGYSSFTPLVRRFADQAEAEEEMPTADGPLTANELADHFPGTALDQVQQQAADEVPARDEPAVVE